MTIFKIPPVTQEIIDDWQPFIDIVTAYIRKELEKMYVEDMEKIEDETLNGTGDSEPIGLMRHD